MRRSALVGIALTTIIATGVSTGMASAHAARNPQRHGADARSLFWPGHQVEPGLAYTDALLYGVTAISPDNAWAVGEQLMGGTDKPLIEHWNGSSWSVVPSPTPVGALYSRLKSVDAVSANNVWAVGDLGLRRGVERTLIEHWNGTSWHRVPSPNPAG